MEKQPTKLDRAVKISIIFGILVALLIAYYSVIFLPQREKELLGKQKKEEEVRKTEELEKKKESLIAFYTELTSAMENKNWEKDYKLSNQTLKENITESQYVSYQKNNFPYSIKFTINNVEVDGDRGFIDRTLIICKTKECLGANRNESKAQKEYVYKNNSWQVIDEKPSERALAAAAYYFLDYTSKSNQRKKDFFHEFSYEVENKIYAIKMHALFLDKNTDRLVLLEKQISKSKEAKDQYISGCAINTPSFESSTPSFEPSSPSISSNNTESLTEQWKREQKAKCQEDINEYNLCMIEYNSKMDEYNLCLNNVDGYCFKPYKLCSKPICAY